MSKWKKAFRAVTRLVNDLVDFARKLAEEAARKLQEEINNATKLIFDTVKNINDSITELVKDIANNIEDIYQKIRNELNNAIEKVEKTLTDAFDSMQQSIVKITGIVAESVLPDFLEQAIKNNIQFVSTFLANLSKNSISLASSAAQGDLKAVEDDLKQTGRDFDDDFHASLRLIEDNANSIADASQYMRDDIIKPAWNIARQNLNEAAGAIEREALRPAINNLISEIDLLVAVAAPDELAKQYERTKVALEDAAVKLKEIKQDFTESLEEFQEELEKAGKTIDDMKIFIAQTAAVIAVSFVPGSGPLLAIALQIAFDEINGNQSLADQLLSGDFSNIDQIIIAVACIYTHTDSFNSAAQAMNAIAKTMEVSAEVAKAMETAAKAYEIYSKINQYKNTVEAIIDGDLKEIAFELIKTAGQEFAASASVELENYVSNINDFVDISKLLENEQLIKSVISLDLGELKDSALSLVAQQVSSKISNYVPKDLENLINQDAFKSLIQGNFSTFEVQAKSFLADTISQYASEYASEFLSKDFSNLLNPDNISQLLNGDFEGLKSNLLQELSQKVANYANLNLPDSIKNFVSSSEISALISGDTSVLEDKLKTVIGDQISANLSGLIDDQLLQAIKTQNLSEIKSTMINYAEGQMQLQFFSLANQIEFANLPQFSDLSELKQYADSQIQSYQQQISSIQQQIFDLYATAQADVSTQIANLESQLDSALNSFQTQIELKSAVEAQMQSQNIYSSLANFKDEILEDESIKNALLFKNSIEQQINQVNDRIDEAQTMVEDYQLAVAEFKEEFDYKLNNYLEISKNEFTQVKVDVVQKYDEINQSLNQYKSNLTDEFSSKINQTKEQIDSLMIEVDQILIENYLSPIFDYKISAETQINKAIDDIKQTYQDKILTITNLNQQLESEINQRIDQIHEFEDEINGKIAAIQTNLNFLETNTQNIFSQEYFDQLQSLKANIDQFQQLIENPDYLDELNIISQSRAQLDQEAQNFTIQSQSILQKIYDSRFEAINQGIIDSISTSSQITNQQFIKNAIQDSLDQIKQQTNIDSYLSDDAIKLIISQTTSSIKSSINIVGGDGYDTSINLAASTTKNYIIDNRGNDNITGGQNKDYIESGEGNDTINAGAGDDIVYAGSGNDNIYGGTGADEIRGGDGDDVVWGGFDIDYSRAATQSGGDWGIQKYLTGDFNGDGKDDIAKIWNDNGLTSVDVYRKSENTYNDIIYGGNGNDAIYCGSGNDILIGGTGNDTLTGGSGSDIFKFNFIEDSFSNLSQSQLDLITDFEKGKDKIDLSTIDSINGFNQFDVIYDAASNTTKIDDKNSDFAVKFSGNVALSESDFIF